MNKLLYIIISLIVMLPLISSQTITKSYVPSNQTLITKDLSNNIQTSLTLKTPTYYKVSTGDSVLFAEFQLNDFNTSKTDLFDSMEWQDINKNFQLINKPYETKYFTQELVTDKETGESYLVDKWIKFTSLKELPQTKNVRIGLFARFDKVGERLEWIPTIDNYKVNEWATLEVTSGSTTLTTELDFNVTIPAVNTSQAFIMHTAGADGTGSLESIGVRVHLVNSTTINFFRDNNTENVYISWHVINSSDLYVQRSLQTISATDTFININEVNLSSSFIIPQMGTATQAGATIIQRNLFATSFVNSTQMKFTRLNTGANAFISWQVVQWNNASVQSGITLLDGALETQSVINSVNLTRSFLLVQPAFNSTLTNARSQGIKGTFINATLLNFSRGFAAVNNATISWWVIEHPNLNVQRGQYNLSDAVPQNITLSTINTSNSFSTLTYSSNSSSNVWGNVWSTSKLTNATNLELQKYLGNNIWSYLSWQVISYNADTPAPPATNFNMTVHSPINTTYSSSSVPLTISATTAIHTAWYNLNSGGNLTFTPNNTITAIVGLNNISVWANNSLGQVNNSIIFFTYTIPPSIAGDISLVLINNPYLPLVQP